MPPNRTGTLSLAAQVICQRRQPAVDVRSNHRRPNTSQQFAEDRASALPEVERNTVAQRPNRTRISPELHTQAGVP